MPSSHLILCHPLLLLLPIPPSNRVFSSESTLRMRWPKYWSFSFSISPSNEHPGLISFRMDWLDLSRVFSNTTVQKHQFFGAQLSSKRIEQFLLLPVTLYSLVAQMVTSPPAMQETWVLSLDQEDPLENGRATHSNILAWEIPWTEEPSSLQSMWSQRVWHNWAINTHTHTHTHVTLYYC